MSDRIFAPWTPEQVRALTNFQFFAPFHPFTCGSGNRGDAAHVEAAERYALRDRGLLFATTDGWECPAEGCDYRQNWAHAFMAKPFSQQGS